MAFLKTYSHYLEYQLSKELFKWSMEKRKEKQIKKRRRKWERYARMEQVKSNIAEDNKLREIAKEKGMSLRNYKKQIKKRDINQMEIIKNTKNTAVPNSEDFRTEIKNQILKMQGDYLEISAKEIHLKLGGYPNNGNHAMPTCCDVMLELMTGCDVILPGGPKSNHGANLVIKYYKR